MFELPTTIIVNGVEYPIRNKGDYRVILDCFSALNDDELDISTRAITALIIFLENMCTQYDLLSIFPTAETLEVAIKEMYRFINCGDEEDAIGAKAKHSVVDWEQDQQLIASAVNNVARTEVRALPYLHWWTFMGYYMGIGECTFSTIVNIRSKIKEGKKLEKYEQDFKKDNPQYFVIKKTAEEKTFDDDIRKLWNAGD